MDGALEVGTGPRGTLRRMWDRISEAARSKHPAQTLTHLALLPFWTIGLIVGAIAAIAFNIVRWVWAAVAVGIREATGGRLPHAEPAVAAQFTVAAAILIATVILVVN